MKVNSSIIAYDIKIKHIIKTIYIVIYIKLTLNFICI